MIRLFVRHAVSDFSTWKKGYDAFEEARKRLGVQADAVFCGAESPEDVTVWHDFVDMATARAFLDSAELAAAMETAGVSGAPEAWFCRRDLP